MKKINEKQISYYNEDLQVYCYIDKTTWKIWEKQDEAILKGVNTLFNTIRLKSAICLLILASASGVNASTFTKKSTSESKTVIKGNLNNESESRGYKVYKDGQELVHDENGNLVKKASGKNLSLIQKCIAEENKKVIQEKTAAQEALLMKLIIQFVTESSSSSKTNIITSKDFLLKSSVKREPAFSDKFFDRVPNKKINKQKEEVAQQTAENHAPQIDEFIQFKKHKILLNKTFLKALALRGGGLGGSGWLAKKGLEYIKKGSTDLFDTSNWKDIFSNPQKEDNQTFIHHLKVLIQFSPYTLALAIVTLLTTQRRDIIAENTGNSRKRKVLQILKNMINFQEPYPYIIIGTCIIFYNRGVFYQMLKGEIKPTTVISEVASIIIKQLENLFGKFATLQSEFPSNSFKDDLKKYLKNKKGLQVRKEDVYIFKKNEKDAQYLRENLFYLSKEAQQKIKDYEIRLQLARPSLDPRFPSNTLDTRFSSEDNNC